MDMGTVVILGLARQGKALARFFVEQGVKVTVSDQRGADVLQPALTELEGLPINYVLGEHPVSLLDDCDMLFVSGGVPLDIPLVQEAQRLGIQLSNDAQEFLTRCPAPVVGITGSAGKTTTTALVGAMAQSAGFRTWVGGNIGNPLINDLAEIRTEDRVIMELSSFQLELMRISPHVAGVLNITPNHLDRHKTMQAYCEAKAHIVTHQNTGDVAVLGYDEPNARALSKRTLAHVRYFSGQETVAIGAFLKGDALMLRDSTREVTVCHREMLRLRGFHNVLNTLAAIVLADAAGVGVDAIRAAIKDFTGVAHRLEEVRRWRDVLWVNDSIATAPERVLAALASFGDAPVVLLAGGRDKDLPWEAFARRVVQRVRVLVVFGEAAALIRGHVERAWHEMGQPAVLEAIFSAATLDDAVGTARRVVQAGDVVLLSPGGTSFDAFKDFAERGERFRNLVGQLT